jgi:hypothetical protein
MSKIGALRDLLVALLQEHERDGALPTSVQERAERQLRQRARALL